MILAVGWGVGVRLEVVAERMEIEEVETILWRSFTEGGGER